MVTPLPSAILDLLGHQHTSSQACHCRRPPPQQLSSTSLAGAMASGMGFNTLPPLPLISTIFGFLACLNLRTVGIDLRVVSRWFGWELALFKVDLTQTGCEGVLESSKALSRG